MRALVCLFLVFLIACNSGVDIEPETPGKNYLVNSFISPQDTVLSVMFSKITDNFDELKFEKLLITDAKIEISSEEKQTLILKYDPDKKLYLANRGEFRIKASKKYFLKITTPDGDTLKAQCSIPEITGEFEYKKEKSNIDIVVSGKWTLVPAFSYFISSGEAFDCRNGSCKPLVFISSSLEKNETVISSLNLTSIEIKTTIKTQEQGLAPKAIFKISRIDEPSFQYFKSINNARIWSSNLENLIPNFTEPSPMYSNIDGGIGIFGGYNTITKTIENL